MLKPPKLAGAGQLRLLVDDLGFDWSCTVIDVHPSSMRRWLRAGPSRRPRRPCRRCTG